MKSNEFNRSFYFIVIAAIVVVVNLIAIFFFQRFDLTEGKIYSLSESSKDVVGRVDDKIIVKAFFTENMPPQLASIPKLVKDYLDEYKAYSNGNFQYEFIDPGSDEEFEKEALKYRIQPAQVNIIENDDIALKKVYLGLALLYEDKKEVIPFIQQENIGTLEYDLTSMIKKLTSEKLPKMGLAQGYGMPTRENLQTVATMLANQYEVVDVDLETGEIPEDLETLLIISPQDSLSSKALFEIDQFIMRGGKTGFFIDKVKSELQQQMANDLNLNIDTLLDKYGVKVNNDLIGDLMCTPISVQRQQGMFRVNTQIRYPFLPLIEKFESKNIVVNKLENISLFFASSLDLSKIQNGLNAEVILKSSKKSLVQQGRYDINAGKQLSEWNFDKSELPMAALVEGKFNSAFSDQESVDGKTVVKTGVDSRVVVFGDGEFMQEGKAISPQNYQLFLNLADWLNADEDLINIRSKEVTLRPIDEISDGMRQFIKLLNIFLAPFIILVAGLMKWQINRSRKSFSL